MRATALLEISSVIVFTSPFSAADMNFLTAAVGDQIRLQAVAVNTTDITNAHVLSFINMTPESEVYNALESFHERPPQARLHCQELRLCRIRCGKALPFRYLINLRRLCLGYS